MAEPSGSKTLMMLISAVAFGLVAAVLSILYLKSREAAIIESLKGEEEVMQTVVVANTELLKGTKLQESHLSTIEMPAKFVADSTLTLDNFDNYLGQFIYRDITPGRPVLASDIDPIFPRDFSDLIPDGQRALTVLVDDVNSISGMLRAGNRVDIYVIIQSKITGYQPQETSADELPSSIIDTAMAAAQSAGLPEGINIPTDQLKGLVKVKEKPKDVIMPVAQDIRVLATGREAFDAYLDQYQLPQFRVEDGFSAITLDVTPRQAALLALADDKGSLIAILRHRDDRSLADFDGVTAFDLVKEAAKMKSLAAVKNAEKAKEDALLAAGYTKNANGEWVDANG
ncbi:MAG: Flp pilus assembly protein CpaB, partial [Proteobacteria bacterium]|nr:Flp pilus assembly protein CpaB [Pseudomonadota bacterium]